MKNYKLPSCLIVILCFILMEIMATSAAAMERACTAMWCLEGYTLNLKAAHWPAGQYTIKVIADDTVYQCQGALPFNGCGQPAMTCSDPKLVIGESGCAMRAETHHFNSLQLRPIPQNISVTIMGPEGSFIYENKTNPQCSYPNGEGCDTRQCCSAVEEVVINWD